MKNSSWLLQHGFYRGFLMSTKRKIIGSSADLCLEGWNSFWSRAKFPECAYHRWEDQFILTISIKIWSRFRWSTKQESDLCINTHDHAECYIQIIPVLIWLTCRRWSSSWNYKKGKAGASRRRETNIVVVIHLFSSPLNKILLSWLISLLPTPEHTSH
jgi:hypothetical protein